MTEDFPWGEVVKLHKIDGLPGIVEYKVGPDFHDPGTIQFNVTCKDGISCSYDTLDEAILGALCEKHKGGSALWHAIDVLFEHSELDHHQNLEVKTMNRNPEPDWREERDAEDDEIPERDDELPPSNTFQ